MKIQIQQLDEGLPVPSYARDGDAGLDLFSAEQALIAPGQRVAISTGVAVAIPEGYAGFVQARSGRALNEGLAVVNTPGLVDSGYRGEVKVIVINVDPVQDIKIGRGDKIAQLVIQPVVRAELEVVDELPSSTRGDGGFGSTGR
jgi:dUTP pyrophosphatase